MCVSIEMDQSVCIIAYNHLIIFNKILLCIPSCHDFFISIVTTRKKEIKYIELNFNVFGLGFFLRTFKNGKIIHSLMLVKKSKTKCDKLSKH